MLFVIDEVLDVLGDGEWHTFEDVERLCRHLNSNQVEAVLSFLDEYGFVRRLRQPGTLTKIRKAKLTPEMLRFLRRVKELEK